VLLGLVVKHRTARADRKSVTSSNPHLRGILIAGALAAVAAALGMFTLSRQQVDSSAAMPTVLPKRHLAPAGKPLVAARPKAHAVRSKAHAVSKAKAAPPRPSVDPVVRAAHSAGLPGPVANAFAGHAVVVVTLYARSSSVDETTEAEAEAGALLAGAGFVPIDVTREGASGALVEAAGVLTPPVTLVYAQPEFKLAARLDGFADKETVAQAARNANPTPAGGTAAQTAWARGADVLCDRVADDLSALNVKTTTDLKTKTPQLQAIGAAFVTGLGKLRAPAGSESSVTQFVQLESQNVDLTEQLVAAVAAKNPVATASATAQQSAVGQQANALALSLGATHCAGAL
jgi:hypothetical protein